MKIKLTSTFDQIVFNRFFIYFSRFGGRHKHVNAVIGRIYIGQYSYYLVYKKTIKMLLMVK